MEVARKVTSELKEDEITRLSEVINEALYGNRETLDSVREMYFEDGRHNFIIHNSCGIVGIIQACYMIKNDGYITTVAAIAKNMRKQGFISKSLDMYLEYAKEIKSGYISAPIGNPYVINMFHKKGFPLPTEMGENKEHLLKESREILIEKNGSDIGITDMFIIPREKFNYPDLVETENAYDNAVIDFVEKHMKPGDRLFMIKELQSASP